MAYTSSALAPRDVALTEPNVRTHRSLFSRLIDAMMMARQNKPRVKSHAISKAAAENSLTKSSERSSAVSCPARRACEQSLAQLILQRRR